MKKLIVVGLAAISLTLTACGGSATGFDQNHYNNTYCEGNVYTSVDEDDYTCSRNGVVYYEGDHEDDTKKKHAKGSSGHSGTGFTKPKVTKPNHSNPAKKAPSNYKSSSGSSYKSSGNSGSTKSYSFKK